MNRSEVPPPPPGFELQTGRGAFTAHNGPYFQRRTPEGVEQAFYALDRHCNGLGLIHGGMITSFLDGLLAGAVGHGLGVRAVTVHLSVDFLAMGRAGEWVIGQAQLSRAARDIAFAEGQARVGELVLARATGVFKLMRRRGA
ncbi:MAG TPA: PaaI family thioesterase [Caulobacteraceae bacterium]